MPVRLIATLENDRLAMDLKDGVYRIGREKPADIVIPSPTISGRHAELQVSGHEVMLRDLGSTNGTFVNGERIRAATPINPKDAVILGSVPINFEHPAPVRAVAPQQPGLAGPTVKIEAAKQVVASKLTWPWRYWIAGAEAILVLLFIFLFIEVYSNSTINEQRTRNNFRLFAEQYVHVLSNPALRPIPSPKLDESLAEPIFVTNADGEQLFPTPDPDPTVRKIMPIVDPKTKKVYESAKYGLFKLPGTSDGDTSASSYPVRSGGDLVGYVIARPGKTATESVAPLALLTMLGGIAALIILAFTLRRVNALLRGQLASMESKVSPLAAGFIPELPRSTTIPELNGLADQIEIGIRSAKGAGAGARGGKGSVSTELAPLIAELVDTAGMTYCFTDGDYKIISLSPQLDKVAEFARAAQGLSIFDGGLNSLQAKLLVQAMADAKREGRARVKLSLTRDGSTSDYAVTIRSQKRPGGDQSLLGLFFEPLA